MRSARRNIQKGTHPLEKPGAGCDEAAESQVNSTREYLSNTSFFHLLRSHTSPGQHSSAAASAGEPTWTYPLPGKLPAGTFGQPHPQGVCNSTFKPEVRPV